MDWRKAVLVAKNDILIVFKWALGRVVGLNFQVLKCCTSRDLVLFGGEEDAEVGRRDGPFLFNLLYYY